MFQRLELSIGISTKMPPSDCIHGVVLRCMRKPFSADMKGSMAARSGEGQARFEVSHNKQARSVLVARSSGLFVWGLPGSDPAIISCVARVCRHQPRCRKVRVSGPTRQTGFDTNKSRLTLLH